MTSIHQSIRFISTRIARSFPPWTWNAILAPFLVTRLAWIMAGLYSSANFLPNPTYQEYHARGWFLSKYFLLDIFSRWDARHYLSIARDGYRFTGSLGETMDNIAFFPLYPYLIKGLAWLAYGWTGRKVPDSLILLVGIILSNLLFLGGVYLLYRLAVEHLRLGENTTRRALVLLFVFPVNFIFSSFYTESLFFFLSLVGFWAAFQRRWMWVGVIAGLLTLTRPPGILAAAAFFLLYLQQREWKLSAVRADLLWLGLSPVLLAAHFYNMFRLTGNFLAPIIAQNAWGRSRYGFFASLRLQLEAPFLDVYKLDALFALIFLIGGIYILWKWPNKALGVYVILMVAFPIGTGMLISAQRFMLVVFPVFLLLGEKIKNPFAYQLVQALCFALQVIYFTAWVNYYWIG